MKRRQRILAILSAIILVVLSACGAAKEVPEAKNWETAVFSYTDQEGNEFSKKELEGKVWMANFIFTSCADVCPPMTNNMAKLQKQLVDEGIEDVEFVSFSVDPEVDQPNVLKEYAGKFNVDFSNWHFLTGYSQAEIENFALKSFKILVKKPENETQVIHDTSFFLLDQEGKIIRYYGGLNDVPYEEIIKHIKILQKK